MASRTAPSVVLALQRNSHACRHRRMTSDTRGALVVFSGIQPTGVPHLGNYLGALSNWVNIQNHSSQLDKLYFCVVGLHAVTLPQDPRRLKKERRDVMTTLLALGLHPQRSCLFHQDEVPAHAELAWLLNCITSVGRLQRMTTWKARLADKKATSSIAAVDDSELQLGLLAYPVLQAADVLLYKTTHVPVGDDQLQHLELARVLASTWNKRFKSDVFRLPRHMSTPQARVLNLRDPSVKMSKSNPNPASRILLTDDADTLRRKIMAAVTDSTADVTWDPIHRPGVSNLLGMYAGLQRMSIEDVLPRFRGKVSSDLKRELVDVLVAQLQHFRSEFARLQEDQGYVDQIAKQGAVEATVVANQTLMEVKQAMGLL